MDDYRVTQDLVRRSDFTKAQNEDTVKLVTVMHPIAMGALFALQCFLFLVLHDCRPFGIPQLRPL